MDKEIFKNACDVSTMLLEAGQYAEQLRQQAQAEAAELLLLLRFGKIWRYWPTGQMMC